MTAQTGHTHAHGRAKGIAVHNLACLVEHLHLFLGVTIVGEDVNLRNHIISQLIGKLIDGNFFTVEHLTVLLLQLCHSSCTCSAGSLIGSHMNALDMTQIFQTLQGYHHHDSGTVGIGNDTSGTIQSILSITFGYHQGHILIHTESR